MEIFLISIIGMVFIIARHFLLKSVIIGAPNKVIEDAFSAFIFCMLFGIWNWIPISVAVFTGKTYIFTTMLLCGAINEDYLALLSLMLAPYKESLKIFRVYAVLRTSFFILASYSLFTVDGSHARLSCIIALVVYSVAVCFYRIVIIGLIIRTRSVQFTPYMICLFMVSSPALWFVFCLFQRDVTNAVPNVIASVLGAVQLITYFIYHDHDAQPKKPSGSQDMEKGSSGVTQVEQA